MSDMFRFGGFMLHLTRRELRHDFVKVRLTAKEFDLLAALCESRRSPLSKDDLIRMVWSEEAISDAALTQSIYRLRRILRRFDPGTRYIKTIAGCGYQFNDPLQTEEHLSASEQDSKAALFYHRRAMLELANTGYDAVIKSIALFEQALRADPKCLPALAGLAQAAQTGIIILSTERATGNGKLPTAIF